MSEPLQIPIRGTQPVRFLRLDPVRDAFCEQVDSVDADASAEVPWQIRENNEYEYSLDTDLRLADHPAVSQSARKLHVGRLRPLNLVGRLQLDVLRISDGEKVGVAEIEVTSRKFGYRGDYRIMLDDIARKATDLVFSSEEAVAQPVVPNTAVDSSTLYQRFAFLRAILESEQFNAALARICASPIRKLENIEDTCSVQNVCHVGTDVARQFASAMDRIALPAGHQLHSRMASVPRRLLISQRHETCDIDENRFVRCVLETFSDVMRQVADLAPASGRLRTEAIAMAEKLERYLTEPFFRQVSRMTRLPLGSMALQRKEGYRDVLRAWSLWETAAKLSWTGGEDVYAAGKKDVANLYEYWCYFKLLDIVQQLFHVSDEAVAQKLISCTNGLTLSLKEGVRTVLHGTYAPFASGTRFRKLAIEFAYNATFSRVAGGWGSSWSLPMRPDYTIALRPDGVDIDTARRNDLVTYVHFDAKYKVDEYELLRTQMKEPLPSELYPEDESTQARMARDVKRVDILKMHAYRDAIYHTGGAYVLYPGEKGNNYPQYHEILPGLGAFPLSPSIDSTTKIESFLRNVAEHLCDRLTQWEELNYQRHAVCAGVGSMVAMLQADAIPGLYKAVKSSGVFPLPVNCYLSSPASIRWITIPDDDPNLPPHVVRVAVNGYRGTVNYAALTDVYSQFVGILTSGHSGESFHIWTLEG